MSAHLLIYQIIVLCVLLSSPAFGATYYVAQTSANLANGSTFGNRMSVEQHNQSNFEPDDIIYLCDTITTTVVPPSSGKKDHPIVYRGDLVAHPGIIDIPHSNNPVEGFRSSKNYITVSSLIIQNIYGQGMEFSRSDGNFDITIEKVHIANTTYGNGILIIFGGENLHINNCVIEKANNTCIAVMGSKSNKMSNTVIENCTVSGALTNDGIMLHKDGEGNDVGSTHLIKNCTASSCSEQGFDITSGEDITLESNKTFANGDSGILVDHQAGNVLIARHLSENDLKYGIIIGDSTNVQLKESKIRDAHGAELYLTRNCESFTAVDNIFISDTLEPIIDIEKTKGNIVFNGNSILVTSENGEGVIIRCLTAKPTSTGLTWKSNRYWVSGNRQRVFYDPDDGIFSFDIWKATYAPTDMFKPFQLPTLLAQPKNLRMR